MAATATTFSPPPWPKASSYSTSATPTSPPGLTADIIWADAQSGFGLSAFLTYDSAGNLDLGHGSVPLAPYGGASALGGGWSYSMAFIGATWSITYSHSTLAPGGKTPTGTWEHFIIPVSLTEGVFLFGEAGDDILIDDSATGEAANLAGGTGDDLYQLGGAGDINLYDNQGYNTLALAAGDSLEGATLALDTDQTGYRIVLTNGRALNIQNGFFGTGGVVQDASGTETDLEEWASSAVAANLMLQLDDPANEAEWRVAA
jgi:hypothetical protein